VEGLYCGYLFCRAVKRALAIGGVDAAKGEVQEGKSSVKILEAVVGLPIWVYAASFFLRGVAFFAATLGRVKTVGFGFYSFAFFDSSGTNAVSAWAAKLSLSSGM
jgi:hypothetical protein